MTYLRIIDNVIELDDRPVAHLLARLEPSLRYRLEQMLSLINEAEDEIADLEAQIEELEARLARLRPRLAEATQ